MAFSDAQVCEWTQQLERFLLKRLGSRFMARDIAHDTVMRLLEAERAGYRPQDPRAWLFRIARNLAVDEVRRILPHPIGLEAMGWTAEADAPGPRITFLVARWELSSPELSVFLSGALEALPPHYQRLLEAHYQDGMSCESMAQLEQLSVANVKVRLYRARRRLRRLLVDAVRQAKAAEP